MNESIYRQFFEKSNDAFLVIRGKLFVDCNEACVKMLRYSSKQEVLNKHSSELSPERQSDGRLSFEKANEMMSIAYEKGAHLFEWDHLRSDGTILPVEVSVKVIKDGEAKILYVSWRDVTELKKTEKQRVKTLAYLNSIIDHSPVCIYLIRANGNILDINSAGLNILGLDSKTQILGENFYDFLDKESQIKFRELNAKVCNGNIAELGFRMLDTKGNIHNLETTSVPLQYNEEDEIVQLGIAWDVTQKHKEMKEKVMLEHRLKQSQKMECLGGLVGGITHDFNNMLTVIIGCSELMAVSKYSKSSVRENANSIRNAAHKAASLTRQLLTFSRKQNLKIEQVPVNGIVNNLLKLLGKVIGEDIEIIIKTDAIDSIVEGDKGKVEQVLMNLVVNARDAMPVGGKLIIETQNVTFDPNHIDQYPGTEVGCHIMIAISDTGVGISKDLVDKVFDPYFTTKEKGTGLGLATVYGIVKQYKGHLSVQSEVGQGSTFKVYLPVYAKEIIDKPIAQEQDIILNGTERILVVDDEETILQLVSNIVKPLGYQCLSASSGKEAMQLLEDTTEPIDLLLTDIVMPSIGGKELSHMFLEKSPTTKVLFISGYTESILHHYGFDDSEDSYIQKPVTPTALMKKIRLTLDN